MASFDPITAALQLGDKLLERFDLRKGVSNTALDKRAALLVLRPAIPYRRQARPGRARAVPPAPVPRPPAGPARAVGRVVPAGRAARP